MALVGFEAEPDFLQLMRGPSVFIFYFLGVWAFLSVPNAWRRDGFDWVLILLLLVLLASTLLLTARRSLGIWLGAFLWGNVLGLMLSTSLEKERQLASLRLGTSDWIEFEVLSSRRLAERFYSATVELNSGERTVMTASRPLLVGHQGLAWCERAGSQPSRFPGDFDEEEFYAGRGIQFKLKAKTHVQWPGPRFAAGVRRHLNQWQKGVKFRLKRNTSAEVAGWLLGLLTGDKSEMSSGARRAFGTLGLAHLTAVSGFHVGLVAAAVLGLLSRVGRTWRWRSLLPLPFIWAYVLFCGAPASALRAAGMLTFFALSQLTMRRADGGTLMALAGTLMLVADPHLARDVGTQLSFLATGGILLWFRSQPSVARTRVVAVLAIPIVATVFTAPVAWPVFGQFPVAFLPANVLATPLVFMAMSCAALHVVLPEEWAQWFGPHLSSTLGFILNATETAAAHCPAVCLPLDQAVVSLAGWGALAMLVVGVVWGGTIRWLGAGLFFALALLRFQGGTERPPQVYALGAGVVGILSHGQAAVLGPAQKVHQKAGHRKTRSFLERVSKQSSEPVIVVGQQLSFTSFALHLCTAHDTLTWITPTPLRCESPCRHSFPKLPSP